MSRIRIIFAAAAALALGLSLGGQPLRSTPVSASAQSIVPVHDHSSHNHAHGLNIPGHSHAGEHAHDFSMTGLARQQIGIGSTPLYEGMGSHSFPITTDSSIVQRYFDQGLTLTYGFNHAEAIRSFKEAARFQPDCAMCYWGIAYALGPNINAPMDDAAVPEAFAAIRKALELARNASEREQAYIRALSLRYAPEPVKERGWLDFSYAAAMEQISRRYPQDADAATLSAEALMDLTPWNFWTKDGQPTQYTEEIVAALERALSLNPNHPGANHFYIHATEASFTPERAIASAERLETLVPAAGHLVHMSAHTYWRVGRYQDAIRVNLKAIEADEGYFRLGGTPDAPVHNTFYALGYYTHNIHFVFAAAQMSGQSGLAVESARKLAASVPDEAVAGIPPLQEFRTMPVLGLVRFGKWDEVLREARPTEAHGYELGIWHWSRGMAFARTGRIAEAREELARVEALAATEEMQKLLLTTFPPASTLLTLAGHILTGEIAGAGGDVETQIERLKMAVAMQDDLPYIEPPSWFYPVRQTLGAVLLVAGRAAEAEAVYREDLRQYPHNGWSLFGLAESLRAQGKLADAEDVQRRFEIAWQNADVSLIASRF